MRLRDDEAATLAAAPRAFDNRARAALAPAVALAFVALSLLPGLGAHDLQDPDEGRYAEIAREMSESGEYISPHLDGLLYLGKPPLFFWLASVAIKVLGATEAAARLPSALAGLACVLLVMRMGMRAFGREVGIAAGLLLAATPMFAFCARTALVDMVLCALVTGALASCVAIVLRPAGGARGHAIAFWALTGLGFLCKGPLAVALPVAWTGLYTLVARDRTLARALVSPLGWASFLAIAAPWFLVVEARHPGFLNGFLLGQNLSRFVDGGQFRRDGPLWYYLPVLLGLLAPWTVFLPILVRDLVARARAPVASPEGRATALLGCAVLGPLMLLSVAHSKLIYYALPFFPPLALLLARAIVVAPRAATGAGVGAGARPALAPGLVAIAAVSVTIGLVAGVTLVFPDELRVAALGALAPAPHRIERTAARLDIALRLAGPLAAIGLSLASMSVLGLALARHARPSLALAPLVSTLVVIFGLCPWIAGEVTGARSAKRAAALLRPTLGPDDVVLSFTYYSRTLPYYLERPVVIWQAHFAEFGRAATADELRERSLEEDEGALAALWSGPSRVAALVADDRDLIALERIVGVDRIRSISRVGQTYLVDNRPADGAVDGRP